MRTPDYFGRFVVRPLKDGRRWAMDSIFGFASRTGVEVRVPIGRTSDFASIPRIAWSIMPPTGQAGPAGWIHDELYWLQWTTREEADKIFDEAMMVSCVGRVKRALMYRAVRMFGGAAWRANARAKARGETRLVDMDSDVFLARLDDQGGEGMA